MKVKKKNFTAAEKYKVALEAIKGVMSISQIASAYGVHPTQIHKWKKEALVYLAASFSNKLGTQSDDHEKERSELYQQIGQLKVENDFLKKKLTASFEDRRILIEPEHNVLSIRKQFNLLGINRSSLYYEKVMPDDETLALMRKVDEVYTQYPFFGTRQMTYYLKARGYAIGRKKVRSVYEKLGLQSVAPGPHTSKPCPLHKIYPYLLRGVEINRLDFVWSTDITYIRLKQGFAYLMAIIDWFSRYVIDWSLNLTLEADFCIEALTRSLETGTCEIFNTDQGSQFTSQGFTDILLNKGIKISMDGKGRALDNIFVERLWRSVKYECIYLHEWNNVRAVQRGLESYFHFYNHERPHQSLGGKTPGAVYLQ